MARTGYPLWTRRSTIGRIWWQGPHHWAWKSRRTGSPLVAALAVAVQRASKRVASFMTHGLLSPRSAQSPPRRGDRERAGLARPRVLRDRVSVASRIGPKFARR